VNDRVQAKGQAEEKAIVVWEFRPDAADGAQAGAVAADKAAGKVVVMETQADKAASGEAVVRAVPLSEAGAQAPVIRIVSSGFGRGLSSAAGSRLHRPNGGLRCAA